MFKPGDEVVPINSWIDWSERHCKIVSRLDVDFWVVHISPYSKSLPSEVFIHSQDLILRSIYNSPLYKALL